MTCVDRLARLPTGDAERIEILPATHFQRVHDGKHTAETGKYKTVAVSATVFAMDHQ